MRCGYSEGLYIPQTVCWNQYICIFNFLETNTLPTVGAFYLLISKVLFWNIIITRALSKN